MTPAMTPERWQAIKQMVNSALQETSAARTRLLQQSCADDFAMRLGAEALLSVTRKLPDQPLPPDQWQHIEQLFQAALELTPSQRPAFLAQACNGDEVLQHEVESLLVYQNAAGALIGDAVHEAAGLLPNDEKARFTPGTTLNKRYRILGLLGKGGMGEVYRADDLKLGQPVALKFLTEKLSQDKAMLARFHSEVSMAHRVTHPNVCRVHDIGEVSTSAGVLPFLSMEYVDGEDLSSLLRRIGRLPADKAVEIANQLCAGLAAAHEAGVLHRDLKPANVMIDGKGRVRITDFGLAGFAEQIKGSEVLAGTPAYMSPEQFAGKEVTTKSDLYALGLVLYEVFTGKRVFEAGSLEELKRMHESSAPTNPSSWVKDLDPLVERVILRCLEKDPARRLASAKQVADALPGGDPLAAALAMGETPSPEMVAAAGGTSELKPKVAVACLVAIIGLLLVVTWLSSFIAPINRLPIDIPPDGLAQKAREFSSKFGYAEKPLDTAYGFNYDSEMREFVRRNGSEGQLLSQERLATARPAYAEYWYRESPDYLLGFRGTGKIFGRVTLNDPPLNVAGMVNMRLDTLGRLRYFSALHSPLDTATVPTTAKTSQWDGLFAAAGLEQARFTATESQWSPLTISDERMAWTGTYPDLPDLPLRLEAAAYRGKLVYFQIIEPWTTSPQSSPRQSSTGTMLVLVLSLCFNYGVQIAAVILAIVNFRRGRGDVRGSFRLALFWFIASFLVSALLTNHAPVWEEEQNLQSALSQALFDSVLMWCFNMALEPFLRRRIPESLITWSRILTGRFRDPRVGRDILIGILAGSVGWILMSLIGFLGATIGGSVGVGPGALNNGRFALGFLIASPLTSLSMNVVILLPWFLLRIFIQRNWVVILCLSGIIGLVLLPGVLSASNPAIVLAQLAGVAGLWTFLLLRFGLVAGTFFIITGWILTIYPITTNFSAWYAGTGFFAIGVLLALTIFGFYTSLGGQKVFSGRLLEE